MISSLDIFIRLALACALGGLIGLEREQKGHPAGLRTHILVCIGATLVMLCNIFIVDKFTGITNVDPARLGAQVISGIGFLGAGTIIKEGISIRGLTTAASLWAVGCLGIAIGLGFYFGAIIATLFILIILIIFYKFEYLFNGRSGKLLVVIKSINSQGQVSLVGDKLKEFELPFSNITVEPAEDNLMYIRVKAASSKEVSTAKLIEELYKLDGIKLVQIND
jgi:putative Mg2+ transporter-C (MgtC) family protein